ncbi:MAG: hypothetical protein HQK55_12560 [Deltaproteobacteria bacterium]|nr:hypothetical protein [Deltaproteobacteria bacterium]
MPNQSAPERIVIENLEHFGPEELIGHLKQVCMFKGRFQHIHPYQQAFISLEKIACEDLHPPQTYVLINQLKKIRQLKTALAVHGLDIYELNGFVRLKLEGYDEPVDLLPPIVEESIERNGRIARIICDGLHRVYNAWSEWVIPQVVYVRGLPKEYPYYAYPNRNPDWTGIVKFEDPDHIPPEGEFLKKWHRFDNYRDYYRDFNSAFKNVGGPRGHGQKEARK